MHFGGFSCITLIGAAFHAWSPAYFIRVHGMETSDVGVIYGGITVGFAICGVLAGGVIGDWLATKKGYTDAFIRVPLWGACILFFPACVATLVATAFQSFLIMAFFQFFASFHAGMAVAGLLTITPPQFKAQATAIYLFSINVIGLGMGPLLVALVTDYGFKDDAAVGYSMAIIGGLASIVAITLLRQAMKMYQPLK